MHRRPAIVALLILAAVLNVVVAFPPQMAAAFPPPTIVGPPAGQQAATNPVLLWNAVAGASRYVVQVATDAAFTNITFHTETANTAATPPIELDPGTLHWRVAVASPVLTEPWATSSFVKVNALTAPLLDGPPNGAKVEYPDAVAVSWQPVPGAAAYDVQWSTSAEMTGPSTARVQATGTTLNPGESVLHWRVRAVSPNTRTIGPWSETRTVSRPWSATPEPISPIARQSVRDALLTWEPVLGAVRYQADVTPAPADWSSAATRRLSSVAPSVLFRDLDNLAAGAYEWRVRGVDANGRLTDWSPAQAFNTVLSAPPRLLAPADGSVHEHYFSLEWTPVERSSRYVVELSTDPGFGAGSISVGTTETRLVPALAEQPSVFLQPGATYFWRVRPIDDPGGHAASPVSATRSFTWQPPAITLASPADGGALDVPAFSWERTGAPSYRVTIRTLDGQVVDVGETEAAGYVAQTWLAPGSYRWRVEAITGGGIVINASDERTVTVTEISASAQVPTPTVPDGLSDWVVPPLTWTPVAGAAAYDVRLLQCTQPPHISCQMLNSERLVYPAYVHPTAAPTAGPDFQYEIVAYDGTGAELATGPSQWFHVTNAPAVTRLAPNDCPAGTCDAHVETPEFRWDPLPGAEWYALIIGGVAVYRTPATFFTPRTDVGWTGPGGDIHWTVLACAQGRCTSDSGIQSRFERHVPVVPVTSPADGSTITGPLTVRWAEWSGATYDGRSHQSEVRDYDLSFIPHDLSVVARGETTDALSVTTLIPAGNWRVKVRGYAPPMVTPIAERQITVSWPAPVVRSPANGASLARSPMLSWEPYLWAPQYQVELYRGDGSDLSMANRVAAPLVGDPGWHPSPLAPGQYAWRVRADGMGGYSDWSATRTFSITTPVPPALVVPTAGASVTGPLLLRWQVGERAVSYRVETSADASFGVSHESVVVTGTQWAAAKPYAAGTWHWRVTSLDGAGNALATSAARTFVVASPAPTPTPTPTPTPSPTPTPTPTPSPTTHPADGVVDIVGHRFETDIRWLYTTGITTGCAPDRFCPDGLVTRAQMATFLSRALSLRSTPTDFFTDDETSKHEGAINRLRAAGITYGCSATKFCPDGLVTRAQMASFLTRAFDLSTTARDYFVDDEGNRHEDAINRLRAAGITSGCAPDRYCPAGSVTRGQMAAFLHRALR